MGKLDETHNFLELYQHAAMAGQTEVPEEFILWSGISLLGAAAQSNIWVKKMGKKLYPNLYTLLIGPSGLGKGEAIDAAGTVGRKVQALHWINTMRSAKSLLDVMTRPDKSTNGNAPKTYSWSKIYVIMPELSMSIGTGPKADDFVKMMTGLYSGSNEEIIDEGTRMHGEHSMPMPNVNWMAGTTKEWLLDSISRASLYGGFLARCACVMADYDLNKRCYAPIRPPDYDEVIGFLRRRLIEILTMRDVEMKLTNQYRDAMQHWYTTREAPEKDNPLMASWKREQDFILKLSTILGIADVRDILRSGDFVAAERLSRSLMTRLPVLVTYAGATPETEAIHRARDVLRAAGSMKQDQLIKRLDITSDRMRIVKETLEKANQIDVRSGSMGGTLINPVFLWKGDPARNIVLSADEMGIESSGIDEAPDGTLQQ